MTEVCSDRIQPGVADHISSLQLALVVTSVIGLIIHTCTTIYLCDSIISYSICLLVHRVCTRFWRNYTYLSTSLNLALWIEII